MAHLEVTTLIAAPPERVWDVIADLEGQRRWMVDVRKLDVAGAQKQGTGTVMRVTSTLFGLPVVRDVMEVTRWEPPHRLDVLHRGQFHGTGSFLLAPAGSGTRFSWTEDFRPPLGALGEMAFAALVRPHLLRVFVRSLRNVRRLAEDSPG
jgi:uncharacterized protein YndB with AHSA1/START domain